MSDDIKKVHPKRIARRLRKQVGYTCLTAEQVAACAEHYSGVANIRAINQIYREQDESHKWPVSGQFDATQRAIRRIRRERDEPSYGLEYAYQIEVTLGEIVNSEV